MEVRGSHLVDGHTRACRHCGRRRFVEAGAAATVPMIGKRFGKLTVIKRVGSQQLHGDISAAVWRCRCDCGRVKDVVGAVLRRKRGAVRSCGCAGRKRRSRLTARS